MSLPIISREQDLTAYLQSWNLALKGLSQNVGVPKIPWNFAATSKRNGILLTWREVDGADGYELLRADDSMFITNPITLPIPNAQQNSYFDSLGGAAVTRYYKILSTAGTQSKPQSVRSRYSGSVSATSIDATDIVTSEVTVPDTFTSDYYQAFNRLYVPYMQRFL